MSGKNCYSDVKVGLKMQKESKIKTYVLRVYI